MKIILIVWSPLHESEFGLLGVNLDTAKWTINFLLNLKPTDSPPIFASTDECESKATKKTQLK